MKEEDVLAPLREVVSIAANHAATALGKLTGQPISVAVPTVQLISIEKILTEVGDEASVMSTMVVKIQGDLQGLLVFSLNPGDAQTMVDATIKHQVTSAFTDSDQTVLRETANIIAGAALNAIAKFLDLRLVQSLPASTTDMLGAVLDPFVAEFGTKFDKVLIQQEIFEIPARAASLKFLAIIDPPSTDRILQKITEKVGH